MSCHFRGLGGKTGGSVNSNILTNLQVDTLVICGGRGLTCVIDHEEKFTSLREVSEWI